jgi:TIR domain
MRIFLCYAEEDTAVAGLIYERLHAEGHTIYNWQSPEHLGDRFISSSEEAIQNADYFFALISPSFLASKWCREERSFALRREHDRVGESSFIQVLKIADVNREDAGFLGNYSWRDMTSPERVDRVLDDLTRMLNMSRPPSPEPDGEQTPHARDAQSSEPIFQNREQELENVLHGLTNASGPHFWLLVGPPQLGKTWFLDRVGKDLAAADDWLIRRVDLRDHRPAVCADPDALLSVMFGRGSSAINEQTLREIAIGIIQSRRPHLYVLDSAELLDSRTAARLREHLSPIYQRVLRLGQARSRLAVIVASRQDDGWRGLIPDPRLSALSLSEFNLTVIQRALVDLAGRTDFNFGQDDYWRFAALVEGLTEGLPELLARCLQWIVGQQWTDLDRMAEPETFRNLAGPYIESELLTSESLSPGDSRRSDDQLLALRSAYRLLAPYRLFTQSHLRHHVDHDPDLTDVMGRLGWESPDLWQAIIGTALLHRPVTEPWQRIQPAVRRLLYHYFYGSGSGGRENGAEVQREASRFLRTWTENQSGQEQVVGLIECLWHEINIYLPDLSAEMAEQLKASARQLSEDLRPSNALTLEELREYAVRLMRGDEEFQQAIRNVGGLFDQLVEIVQWP